MRGFHCSVACLSRMLGSKVIFKKVISSMPFLYTGLAPEWPNSCKSIGRYVIESLKLKQPLTSIQEIYTVTI